MFTSLSLRKSKGAEQVLTLVFIFSGDKRLLGEEMVVSVDEGMSVIKANLSTSVIIPKASTEML